jgi:release factor glutamine methyltransferase
MTTGGDSGERLRTLIADAADRLHTAGLSRDTAVRDARLLAQHALGWTAAQLFMDIDTLVAGVGAATFEAFIRRRIAREPVAYIVGSKEFWGLELTVTKDVLIPRPETEFVVETLIAKLPRDTTSRVLDLCTGSGCLAIAIAHELRSCTLVAADISAPALTIAQQNAVRHGVADRITFVQGDLFAPVSGRFAAIVANPPYVRAVDRRALQPEVGQFEPSVALFGGDDGLDLVARLVATAPHYLEPGGWLLFEFGFAQDDAVLELISRTPGLRMEPFVYDLQGIPRIAVARQNSP